MDSARTAPPVVFEPAGPEHLDEVVRVLNAAWLPVGQRLGVTRDTVPGFPAYVTRQVFQEYVAEHGMTVYAGRVGSTMVAEGSWSPDPDDPEGSWLNRLAVHPDHQRRGYGKALVRWLEEKIAEAGLRVIRLGHVTAEEPLHDMYTRMGYRTTEVRLSTKWLVDITYMEKHLSDTGGN